MKWMEVSAQEGRESTADMMHVHSTAKEGSHKWRGLARTTVLSAMEINPLDELGPAVCDSEMQNTKGCTPKWAWTFPYFFYGQQKQHLCFIILH